MGVLILLVYVGLASGAMMFENIIFQKLNDVTTTRSKWLVTFVIDLKPYQSYLTKCQTDINDVALIIHKVINKNYSATYSGIESMFVKLDQEIDNLNITLNNLRENFLEYHHLSRPKRSLLLFVGKALSFLFGTVSDEDLESIKRNVHNLATNQARLAHVVQEGLTILNVSRVQIGENRHAINEIVDSLQQIDNTIQNVTDHFQVRIDNMEWAVKTYLQIELVIEELRQTIETLTNYLEHLHLQLNMLSLGHMSPSTITPTQLLTILREVKIHLPPRFKLAGDPENELWDFYRTLKCTTLLYDNKIVVVVSLPLLDLDGHVEIYQAHNLPVPILANEIDNPANSLHNLIAKYKLEASLIAVNTKRTKYMLLKDTEKHGCTASLVGYCQIQSPAYPINFSQLCIVSLFMKNEQKVKKFCRTEVMPQTILPLAEYLTTGQWVIATRERLDFTIVCESDVRRPSALTARPPLGVIRLEESCSASNDYLTLLPYYQNESRYSFEDKFLKLINRLNVTQMLLVEPLQRKTFDLKKARLPKKLRYLDKIPMDHLIEQLESMGTIEEMETGNYLWTFVMVALSVTLIIVLVTVYSKFIKPWLAKRIRRGKHTHVASGFELVPVETEGAVTTDRERIASAPLVPGRVDGTGTTTVVRQLYPSLDVTG
ncbi:uncharacterized protein LOC124282108 [Haliotis rubra]|uniref:uncharacterized protein LOC124282108 n=1 Tax=Haliotis rubra TaxID=36100 RepID=UPI001EE50EA6|nr:uncharacterized protein LOC124282108 [Haliotis rubra]